MEKAIKKALKKNDDSLLLSELEEKVLKKGKDGNFKTAFQQLVDAGRVMNVDGTAVLIRRKRSKDRDEDSDSDTSIGKKKAKKAKKDESDNKSNEDVGDSGTKAESDEVHTPTSTPTTSSTTESRYPDLWATGEQAWRDGSLDQDYLDTNPDGITRLFVGNLNKNVTEEQLRNTFDGIHYIKWIQDKTTREFYGTTYIEMSHPRYSIAAVKMDRQKLAGRPLKVSFAPPLPPFSLLLFLPLPLSRIELHRLYASIDDAIPHSSHCSAYSRQVYYCPPKPGSLWPPANAVGRPLGGYPNPNEKLNGTGANAVLTGNALLNADGSKRPNPHSHQTPKPPNCTKLYMGNLSYDVDDDGICDFFKDCGEVIGLRWLTRKETGEFRGCGFIQFASTGAADKAFAKDGEVFMNRPIKLDWTN